MKLELASKLAERIMRIAAAAWVELQEPPLTPGRDFNEEERLERFAKSQRDARVELHNYLIVQLMGVSLSEKTAKALDAFYRKHVDSSGEQGLFERALREA